jgi:nucleoid-associated protein YgaU
MKNNLTYLSILAGGVAMVISGCAPQLARTPYGPEEVKWQNYVQKTYSNWAPPPTPAPDADNTNNASVEESTIEVVPEASKSDITDTGIQPEIQSISKVEPTAISNGANTTPGNTQSYVVKKGDTLWTISYKFYNSGNGWKKIQEANIDQLPTPDKLRTGMTLKIPAK